MAERTIEEKLRAVAEHETAQATVIKNWFIPDEPSETLASLCTRAAEAIAALSRDLEEAREAWRIFNDLRDCQDIVVLCHGDAAALAHNQMSRVLSSDNRDPEQKT